MSVHDHSLLKPPGNDQYQYAVTWVEAGDRNFEWFETKDEAITFVTREKLDAMNSGDPIDYYLLHLELVA